MRLALLALSISLATACGGSTLVVSAPVARHVGGPWTLMYFGGGPPAAGQITDTARLDPARDRNVHIERSVAGVEGTQSCEAEAADDAAWSALLEAMEDADLESALTHPDDLPRLMIDAGYFSCDHDGARVARSDMALAGQPALEAISRLHAAYDGVLVGVLASPSCAPLGTAP